MADKTINTRIVLRNDTLANWNSSTKPLLKGEVALALRPDGSYEVRVGDGVKTWSELSNTGFGHTKFYERSAFSDLSTITDAPNGSIGVVTETIADDKVSKTAYSYNAEELRWEALDGNYSAENVYFKSDFTLAGDYTQVGNVKLADGTLAATGKSVKTVFEDIFDKTIQPSLSDAPTANCTLTNAGSKEVGTVFSPSWSTSLNQGKYYQSWNNTKVNDGTSASGYTVSDSSGHSSTSSSGSFDSFTVGDSTNYKVTSKISYSAGTIAKDNKGNNSNPVVQRAAGTTANKDSSSVTGYRKPFWGYKLATDTQLNFNALTSAQIRSLPDGSKGSSGTSTAGVPSSFVVPVGTKQVIFAVKAGTKNSMTAKDANALNAPVTFTKKAKAVSVEGLNSYTATDYDIWYCDLDSATGAAKAMDLRLTWA